MTCHMTSNEQAWVLAVSIFPHCFTIAIEALLLNSKDIEFLGTAHIVVCAGWAAFLPWQARTYPVSSSLCLSSSLCVRVLVCLVRMYAVHLHVCMCMCHKTHTHVDNAHIYAHM